MLQALYTVEDSTHDEHTAPQKKKEEPKTVHIRIADQGVRHRPMINRSRTACARPVGGYYMVLDESYDDPFGYCEDGCFTPTELTECAERTAERERKREEAELEAIRDSEQRILALQADHESARKRLEVATGRMAKLEREDVDTTDTATDPTRATEKEENDD